jgi:hypothetical protein
LLNLDMVRGAPRPVAASRLVERGRSGITDAILESYGVTA